MHPLRIAGVSSRLHVACAGLALLVTAVPVSAGLILQPGTYRLEDHPDGNAQPPGYGLRLDELIDVTDDHDIFTFSFDPDRPGVDMRLRIDTKGMLHHVLVIRAEA